MKIQNVFSVVCLLTMLAAICVAVFAADEKPCKVPSKNTKKCFHPTNAVTDCTEWPGGDCVGRSIYSIVDFPDGTDPSDEGTTSEVMENCYRETRCRQKIGDATQCETAPTLPYVQAAKVSVGEGTCPSE
ncbi:MAG: hypothetical protein LBF88_14015 [Planctomycetaceae bacterium]|jgi:hypothetical protein|nr:hypothetical protein [Planctomycetaceae bacterium]